MRAVIFSVSFLLLCSNCSTINAIKKVDVDVYYESLCPDSLKFIVTQLYPAWNEISPFVNLKFIPFGKSASLDDKESFICQHGPLECMGNRIMSCALDGLDQPNMQVEFVNCFMLNFAKSSKGGDYGKLCADNIALNWKFVTQCYNSKKGTDLQLKAETETNAIRPSFVPTIIINKKFDQAVQNASQDGFLNIICSYIQQINPNACRGVVSI